jgi:5-methylcytosine-specific restriction endonuclease McrA
MHAIEYSRQATWWPAGTRGLRVCEPEHEYGTPDWQRADRELRRIARGRAGLDYDAAVWILRAVQAGTARMLGMGSDVEYVARVLQCGGREAYERVRGRASYQIAVDLCPECKRATRTTDGESLSIDEAVVAMAACDAEVVDLRPQTKRAPEGTPQSDAASARGPEDAAAAGDGAGPEHVATPVSPRATLATHDGRGPHAARATQTIPPATRRLVLRRDHGRCVVPGCTHATFVDLHHVTPRSEGGTHDPDGLATVCGAHHAALHEGRLSIEGRASTGFVVRHADGTSYGDEVSSSHGVMADVFLALRALGFKETESRRALAAVHTHVGMNPCFDSVLRRALAVLRASS